MQAAVTDSPPAFRFRRWVGRVFLGWLLGIVLLLVLSGLFEAIGLKERQFYLGLGSGTGVGLLQWLELRRYGPISGGRWVAVTVLGLSLPFLLFDFPLAYLPAHLAAHRIGISVVAGGLLTGALQSRLLLVLTSPGWWVMANAMGWPLAAATVFLVDYTRQLMTNNLALFLLNLTLILAGGVVLGLITGWVLRKR